MWEVMYAVNLFYCHWLMKLLSAKGLTEYKARLKEIYIESRQSVRHHVATRGEGRKPPVGTLLVGHKPHGKI